MPDIIEIRYSDRDIRFDIIICEGNKWAWLTKSLYVKYYVPGNHQEFKDDICLFDYFEDVLNPTETELSLLELQHNIRYIKD